MPGSNSDVKIYSGGNDTVTLDTNATINSLMLGGVNNGTTSELTDGGAARTLTITNGLTVGQTGELNLSLEARSPRARTRATRDRFTCTTRHR